MQVFGIVSAAIVVYLGFMERSRQITFFDPHALGMIIIGMIGAIILGSRPRDFWQTFKSFVEILPYFGSYARQTDAIELERSQIETLWAEGKRSAAAEVGEQTEHEAIKLLMDHVMSRADEALLDNRFTALGHRCVDLWEPAAANWEIMAKLGPAFGMIGTLTGMIQLFKNFGTDDANLGAALSLALLSTLYGLVLGAGIAGPIGTFLNTLNHQRLSVLKRCHKTATQLIRMS